MGFAKIVFAPSKNQSFLRSTWLHPVFYHNVLKSIRPDGNGTDFRRDDGLKSVPFRPDGFPYGSTAIAANG